MVNLSAFRNNFETSTQCTPRCPECQSHIQQYATQRYNRVTNRAAIDEMFKCFLKSDKARLQALEGEAEKLRNKLCVFLGCQDFIFDVLRFQVSQRNNLVPIGSNRLDTND